MFKDTSVNSLWFFLENINNKKEKKNIKNKKINILKQFCSFSQGKSSNLNSNV